MWKREEGGGGKRVFVGWDGMRGRGGEGRGKEKGRERIRGDGICVCLRFGGLGGDEGGC